MRSLQSDPDSLRSRRVVAFSVDVTAELRDETYHFAQPRRRAGYFGSANDFPNRFPFRRLEHGLTTDVRTTSAQAAHVQRSPRHDQVNSQAGPKPLDVFEPPLFHTATRFENSEEHLNHPASAIV